MCLFLIVVSCRPDVGQRDRRVLWTFQPSRHHQFDIGKSTRGSGGRLYNGTERIDSPASSTVSTLPLLQFTSATRRGRCTKGLDKNRHQTGYPTSIRSIDEFDVTTFPCLTSHIFFRYIKTGLDSLKRKGILLAGRMIVSVYSGLDGLM